MYPRKAPNTSMIMTLVLIVTERVRVTKTVIKHNIPFPAVISFEHPIKTLVIPVITPNHIETQIREKRHCFMVKCSLGVMVSFFFQFGRVVVSMSHAFRYRVSISYKPLHATIIYIVHHFFNVCCHRRVFYSGCRFCAVFAEHRAVAWKSTSWVHIPIVLWMTEPYVSVRSLLHRRLQSMVRHNLRLSANKRYVVMFCHIRCFSHKPNTSFLQQSVNWVVLKVDVVCDCWRRPVYNSFKQNSFMLL